MPKLTNLDDRPFIKLTLPSTTADDEAVAEVYTEPLAIDIETIAQHQGDNGAMVIAACKCAIKSWNFMGANGQTEDITVDNVRRMRMEDIYFIVKESGIMDKYNRMVGMNGVKKNS